MRAALAAIAPRAQRLAERAVEKALREDVMHMLPGRSDIAAGRPIQFSFDVASVVATELRRLNECVARGDLLLLINQYPVRETPALSEIASKLGFQGRGQYETAVLKLLMERRSGSSICSLTIWHAVRRNLGHVDTGLCVQFQAPNHQVEQRCRSSTKECRECEH